MIDVLYVIIGIVVVLFIYTTVIGVAIYKAYKRSSIQLKFLSELKSILEEVKDYIEEEQKMNELTLEHLITRKPTEEDYKEVMYLLKKLLLDTYKDYKFLIAKSQDETKQPHFIQIVSNWNENPELHKEIFKKAIETNIDMPTLRKKFAELIAEGEVLDLGENIVVITDDGTNQPPTGVSPINSGIEGGEIAFIISFIKKENYDEWYKNTFPQEEQEDE